MPCGNDGAGGRGGIVPHRDPAYAHYRAGMNAFMKIHPSKWHSSRDRFDTNLLPMDEAERDERRTTILGLIALFPEAYRHFSAVVHDHPDSPWTADALEKMRLIEERTLTNARILASFDAWPEVAKEGRKRVEDIVSRSAEAWTTQGGRPRWPKDPAPFPDHSPRR